MAYFSGGLEQVSFLAGWKGTDQLRQQEQAGQLAQAQNLMGILSAAQAQQQKQAALQRQEQFRAGIRPDMTGPELLAHARQNISDPKYLATLIQQEQLKTAQIDSTKQTALNNLNLKLSTEARHAYEFAQKLPIQQRDAALREINARVNAAYKAGSLAIESGNLQYNTGTDIAPLMQYVDQIRGAFSPQAAGAAPTAPTGALSQPAPAAAPTAPRVPSPAGFPRSEPTDGLQTQLSMIQKEIADEIALADQNKDNPQQREVHLRNAQSLQSELGKITPQEAPVRPPAPPNNFDARDLRLQQGALSGQNPQPQPAAAPTPLPTQDRLPTLADAPSGLTPKGKQEWLLKEIESRKAKGQQGDKIVQTQVTKSLEDNYTRLRDAPQAIANIEKAKALIPQARLFQGSLGEQKLAAAKFFNNNLGMTINLTGVNSAEELRSRLFFNIMDNLKKMDAQPSQLQQQIMQDALGKLGTDPGALPSILDAFGDVIRDKVSAYDKQVDEAKNSGINWPHRITLPPASGKRGARPSTSSGWKDL